MSDQAFPPATAPFAWPKMLCMAIFLWLNGFVIGAIFEHHIGNWISQGGADFGTVTPAIHHITADQKKGELFFSVVPPIDIQLRFMPPDQIRDRSPGTYAFTYQLRTPCQIIMPSGIEIAGMTAHWPYASFVNPLEGDVLAHEILHCLHGTWHGKEWPQEIPK